MDHEARIKAAMEQGGIRRAVVIDDAFDPPAVGDEDAGPLMDFLTKDASQRARNQVHLSPEEIEAAVSALNRTEYDEEGLTSVVAKIYAKFVEKFEKRFDPSGRFTTIKGSNLAFVRPLLKLLGKCQNLEIVRVGSRATVEEIGIAEAQVVFVDYYLDGTLAPNNAPNEDDGKRARGASIRVLRDVLTAQPGTGPSVMLMSSHAVADKADAFRREVRDKKKPIFASRFNFMAKNDLTEEPGGKIEVAAPAADALLDIAQRHAFAGAIEDALTAWKDGVDKAVKDVWETITELELKDFAYLSRFRLADEGQPLSSYLEWFFGEVLIDSIARSVDWEKESFTTLDEGAAKGKAGSQIEGAFDGPTEKIAELYYRARVDERQERQGKDLRLGDVYAGPVENEVLAVLTPECDLVVRRKKRAAPRLTVVAGALQPLNAPDSSIADFFKCGGEAFNVVWNVKDVRTVEFESIGAEGGVRLLGTLRPLYAQELQRRVLNELGRVGLAVAPAMAVTAKAEVVVRGAANPLRLALANPGQASCAVIPKRGGADKPRIVYHRSFALEVLEKLAQQKDEVHKDAKGELTALLLPQGQISFIEKLCREGQQDGELALGVLTTLLPERTGDKAPWCQILVTYHVPGEERMVEEGEQPEEQAA